VQLLGPSCECARLAFNLAAAARAQASRLGLPAELSFPQGLPLSLQRFDELCRQAPRPDWAQGDRPSKSTYLRSSEGWAAVQGRQAAPHCSVAEAPGAGEAARHLVRLTQHPVRCVGLGAVALPFFWRLANQFLLNECAALLRILNFNRVGAVLLRCGSSIQADTGKFVDSAADDSRTQSRPSGVTLPCNHHVAFATFDPRAGGQQLALQPLLAGCKGPPPRSAL